MPGPLIAKPQLPEWADPANRSVFDYPGQGLLRTVVGLLGLDDPNQVMMAGGMVEAGPMTGGLVAAVKAKAPEVLEAVAQRLPRFAKAIQAYHGSPTKAGVVSQPFYSRLDEAAATLPKSTFGPKITGLVQKGQASTEELAARGVPEFVASHGNKPITKAALEAHLEAHPVPQLDVKTLGGSAVPTYEEWLEKNVVPLFQPGAANEATNRAKYAAAVKRGTAAPTKFSQYQLPGGENYRETLITLPTDKTAATAAKKARLRELTSSRDQLAAELAELMDAPRIDTNRAAEVNRQLRNTDTQVRIVKSEKGGPNAYRSSHFAEPNILAHTRSNERTLPGLGRGTFLEEVQSDWHQTGKSKGYQAGDLTKVREEAARLQQEFGSGYGPGVRDARGNIDPVKHEQLQTQLQAHAERLQAAEQAVPDAPFKETWPDLALKHHLAEAAENPDTHWLGFTSGETQAARYDLSKQVSGIKVAPVRMAGDTAEKTSGWRVTARGADGRSNVITEDIADLAQLSDLIGKDAAKVAAGQIAQTGAANLEGLDLRVGGEGMHAFYDNLLPKRLEKIVKPYGGTVERMPLSQPRKVFEHQRGGWFVDMGKEAPDGPFPTRAAAEAHWPAEQVPAWILKLTPELKAKIRAGGLPLMTGLGAVELGRENK